MPGRDDFGPEFSGWLAREEPFPSFGRCVTRFCGELAQSPIGLCADHETCYKMDSRPGGAALEKGWLTRYELRGMPVPVEYQDEDAFRAWAAAVLPPQRAGQLNLSGLRPLVKAELKWGLFAHTRRSDRTRWWMPSLQRVVEACTVVSALDRVESASLGANSRLIHQEVLRELRIVYITPSDAREAGYIEFDHFGKRVLGVNSEFSLTAVPQRWLRDLVWDFLAGHLRAAGSARGANYYHEIRTAFQELGAFLERAAPRRRA